MKLKAVTVIVLTLLFVGMLTLAFNIQQAMSSGAPLTEWNRTYGGDHFDQAECVVETSDGGYALAGSTYSFGAGDLDFWFVKTDGSGNHQWNKTYGGTAADHAYSIVETSDGGYIVAGETLSFGAGHSDFWLIKTDAAGNMQWNKTYGGPNPDWATSAQQTSDGGYAIAGPTWSFGAGQNDGWLVKTDAMGNMQWNKTYGGADLDGPSSVVQTSDGGYVIAGFTQSFGAGNFDFWLIKTDAAGNMQWNKTYGGTASDGAGAVQQTIDGGYILAGPTMSFGVGGQDFWLVKTDGSGNHQWNKTYGGFDNDWAECVVETSDGGYALVGYTYSFGAGSLDFWLVKVDSSGNHQWNKTYGGANYEFAYSVVETSDGGYALAGGTESFGAGYRDFWLVKVHGPTGDINGDEIVDIFDGVIIAVAFGSRPGDPMWNPIADIVPDNIIDIQDIVLWATHFGEIG